MNPDAPIEPRQALEASLTALLLGELPHEQAAALHQRLAQEPELAALYERLKQTIKLVRETVASPASAMTEPRAALKLSEARRQKLLVHFKTVAPMEFKSPPRRMTPWLVPVGIAAGLVLIMGALLLPSLSRSKTKGGYEEESLALLSAAAPQHGKEGPLLSVGGPPVQLTVTSQATDEMAAKRIFAGDFQPLATSASFPSRPPVANVASHPIVLPQGGKPDDGIAVPLAYNGWQGTAARGTTAKDFYAESLNRPGGGWGGGGGGGLGGGATFDQAGINSRDQDPLAPAPPPAALTDGSRSPGSLLAFSKSLRRETASSPDKGVGGRTGEPVPADRGAGGVLGAGGQGESQNATSTGSDSPASISAGAGEGGGVVAPNAAKGGAGEVARLRQLVESPQKGELTAGLRSGGAPQVAGKPKEVGVEKLSDVGLEGGSSSSRTDLDALGLDRSRDTYAANYDWGLTSVEAPKAEVGQGFFYTKKAEQPGTHWQRAVAVDKDGKLSFGDIKATDETQAFGYPGRSPSESGQTVTLSANAKLPVLGDVPAAGRFFHLSQDDIGGKATEGGNALAPAPGLAAPEAKPVAAAPPQLVVLPPEPLLAPPATTVPETILRHTETLAALSDTKETSAALKDSAGRAGKKVQLAQANVERLSREMTNSPATAIVADREPDVAVRKLAAEAPVPQPEVQASEHAFSTFSLNVSDVSFKLAGASLEKGGMPEPTSVRSEEFINAFDYRDPEPPAGVPVAFAWERARYPFAQNRDLLRFSVKTAALGRQSGRPLNLVLLLDNSGSMERADRVRIIREALRVLAAQLQPLDRFSVITFARTARLWVDGVPGDQAAKVVEEVSSLTPQGGTNLEEAMNLAYQTALRHYLANGVNRVVLLTDGAANLGDVNPAALKQKVETNRKQGIALDCFGIGWEGYNDDLLEVLSRHGDGRYGFVNSPEEEATEFAGQLAGALHVAASDVKVQVEFNPARVTAYRQIGYAKHQLTKEQFRDNTVDAAEIGAAESGNAVYVVEVNPRGDGPLATVRVRYKVPGTSDCREQEWPVPYTGNAVALEQASAAMRLAAVASAFSEWLAQSPYAAEVTPDRLLGYLGGLPELYGADARHKKLEWMVRQAKNLAGK